MSGTSVDGLDMALCAFSGSGKHTQARVLHHDTATYSDEQRALLKKLATSDMVSMEELALLHTQLAHWHSDMILTALRKWNVKTEDVDLIASHGQTVRHAPQRIHGKPDYPNATFQIGDADHISCLTGIPVVSDFRQKHVAAGGEGAPLACYGDQILFSKEDELRILLNIGGIANITLVDGRAPDTTLPLTFDTGPGNTLMDAYIHQTFPSVRYDAHGAMASRGAVHPDLLLQLKRHPYFSEQPPKTTGPELLSPFFIQQALDHSGLTDLPPEDVMATLNRFTAETIADAVFRFGNPGTRFTVLVSGGGVHNVTLMTHLRDCFKGNTVLSLKETGIHPDAKEALLFATLANEFICGNSLPVPLKNGEVRYTVLGRLSLP